MFKLEKKCGGYVYRDQIFFTRPTKKQIEKIDEDFTREQSVKSEERKQKDDYFKSMPLKFRINQGVELLKSCPWLKKRWERRAKKGNVIAIETLKIIGE